MENIPENENRYDDLEQLLAESSPRARASVEVESAVRAAVRSEWETMITKRRHQRLAGFGIAASVLIFVLGTGLFSTSGPPAPTVAAWERVAGSVSVETSSGESGLAQPGSTIARGTTVTTDKSAGAAILWGGQISLRMNGETTLHLLSDSRIELVEGEIYVDTRETEGSGALLRIDAADAEIQHVGTQYMVAYRNRSLSAIVRSGSIEVAESGSTQQTSEGQMVTRHDSGAWSQRPVDSFGSTWKWAEEISPRLDVQGQSLWAVLDWAARETGREVYYASREARVLAESKTLESDTQMEVVTALQVVTMTSDLRALVDGARIIVDMKQSAAPSGAKAVP